MVKLEVIYTFFFRLFYNLKRPIMTRYYFYNQQQLYLKQMIMVVKLGVGRGLPELSASRFHIITKYTPQSTL